MKTQDQRRKGRPLGSVFVGHAPQKRSLGAGLFKGLQHGPIFQSPANTKLGPKCSETARKTV